MRSNGLQTYLTTGKIHTCLSTIVTAEAPGKQLGFDSFLSGYPVLARNAGFIDGSASPHVTRTIMLPQLRTLLGACAPQFERSGYRNAVVDDNVLLKATATTRRKTFIVLGQLYGLDPSILLFRALRDLWDTDTEAQPLLAVLCAVARDPTLRATAPIVLGTPLGGTVTAAQLSDSAATLFPERFSAHSIGSIGKNAASSWAQAGHLNGRVCKIRRRVNSRPVAVAYALLLGHLCGERGDGLFETLWARVLDGPAGEMRAQAAIASQQGWLEYRFSGGVTEVTFRHLLRDWPTGEGA